PQAGWDTVMQWPGGIDPHQTPIPASYATRYADYVANALYNANGQYPEYPNDSLNAPVELASSIAFTKSLMGFAGDIPASRRAVPATTLENGQPRVSGSSYVFVGADLPWVGTALQDSDGSANTLSGYPFSGGLGFYRISPSADDGENQDANEGIFPLIPALSLPNTTATYASQQSLGPSSLNADSVFIKAKYIDVAAPINIGKSNSQSVTR